MTYADFIEKLHNFSHYLEFKEPYNFATQSVDLAISESHGSLLKMQNYKLHPSLTETESVVQ